MTANSPQTSTPPVPADGYAGDITPHTAWAWVQAGEGIIVDVRSDAERAWVGFVPDAVALPLLQWPGSQLNTEFDAGLMQLKGLSTKLLMLCRSGQRSITAARRAQALGLEAYNILEGFEGSLDAHGHRGNVGGWRYRQLPWRQN